MPKLTTTFFVGAAMLLLFNACNDSSMSTTNQDSTSKQIQKEETADTMDQSTIRAQFVEFHLGDAEHYIFRDEAGKEWDFRGSDDKSQKFAVELPENQTNEQNQGWTSNKDLQGKWFLIKYEMREQPEYQDGPVAKVPVIVEIRSVK